VAPKPPMQKRRSDQKFDQELSGEHCDIVGRVIVAWGRLEAALEELIWYFLDLPIDDGRVVTSRLDARTKIEMLRSFGPRHLADETNPQFSYLLNRISDLKDDRNFVAHGLWGTFQPENIPMALSTRPAAPLGEVIGETFPPHRMAAIYEGISAALDDLVTVRDALAASRQRQPRQPLPSTAFHLPDPPAKTRPARRGRRQPSSDE